MSRLTEYLDAMRVHKYGGRVAMGIVVGWGVILVGAMIGGYALAGDGGALIAGAVVTACTCLTVLVAVQ